MRANNFRAELRKRLTSVNTVILRVLVSRSDSAPVELNGQEVLDRSLELADRYLCAPDNGVVLLLLPHSVELFLLHIGLILRGRVPAILAWPNGRVDPEKYQRNLLHQLSNLPAAQLLTLPRLAHNLDPGLPYHVTGCTVPGTEQQEKQFELDLLTKPVKKQLETLAGRKTPEGALFLQFSGGTTGDQKCVVVTAEMLEAQLHRLATCLDFGPGDAIVSWLPMYHDMGLIACFWLALWSGVPSIQFSAQDWLMDPGLLFRLMDRFRATFCWLPNFAFSYLSVQRSRMKVSCSLGHVRAWINCSEPVRLRSIRAFTEAFLEWGVSPQQCRTCYAMAENVFAITQSATETIPKTALRSQLDHHAADLIELPHGVVDDVYVSSGKTLPGAHLRIRRADGCFGVDDQPGGIEIQTECMFSGYWGTNGFQTNTFTSDGWYSTGDYGFVNGQDLFVIGRTKDIVIVGGQNVFPEDVESVASTVDGAYPGRAVAFGIQDAEQGTENLTVIVEMRGEFEAAKAQRMEREIQRLVLATIGVAPRFVRVVPERWIVKSTAGKISRRETRARFIGEARTPPPGKATNQP